MSRYNPNIRYPKKRPTSTGEKVAVTAFGIFGCLYALLCLTISACFAGLIVWAFLHFALEVV